MESQILHLKNQTCKFTQQPKLFISTFACLLQRNKTKQKQYKFLMSFLSMRNEKGSFAIILDFNG